MPGALSAATTQPLLHQWRVPDTLFNLLQVQHAASPPAKEFAEIASTRGLSLDGGDEAGGFDSKFLFFRVAPLSATIHSDLELHHPRLAVIVRIRILKSMVPSKPM